METHMTAARAAMMASCLRSRVTGADLLLDGGLFGKHDRDVVPHGVYALALRAAQPRPVLHHLDRNLADRAGQELEQVRMDRHGRESSATAGRPGSAAGPGLAPPRASFALGRTRADLGRDVPALYMPVLSPAGEPDWR